ncbi:AAA family ATPase, partial [Enterococcus avium]
IMKQLESGLVSKKLSKNESTLLTQIQNGDLISIGDETDTKKYYDITSLVSLLKYNEGFQFKYEIELDEIIENNTECEFLIEQSYYDLANKIFKGRFQYESKDGSNSPKTNTKSEKTATLKPITMYKNGTLPGLKKNKVLLNLSQLVVKNGFLYLVNYDEIDENEHYLVDISGLFSNSILESSFGIEIAIVELTHTENIEFCINEDYKKSFYEKIYPLFSEVIETDVSASKEVLVTPNSILDFDKKKANELFTKIRKEYFGQEAFLQRFEEKMNSFIVLNKLGRSKILSLLLCGSSGSGKTEVARLLHKHLYPATPQIKINFGNYSGQGSLWSLIGSPRGYQGNEEGGELTNKIKKSDSKIILIDEFDRADKAIFDFFYELLEDGSYTDLNGDVVDLNGYIIILTSNLTKHNYFEKLPESLISRIDMCEHFKNLSPIQRDEFIYFTVIELINDYEEYLKSIAQEYNPEEILSMQKALLEIDYGTENNLRRVKRIIFNQFSKIIEN